MSFHASNDTDELDLAQFGTQRRAPLVPSMFPVVRARTALGTKIYAALTVERTEVVPLRWGRTLRADFSEYPEHTWWTNLTMLKILVDKLGKSPAEWVGARVPLTVADVLNPTSNKVTPRMYPVQGAEWDEAFDAYDLAARARQRSATTAAGAPPAQAAVTELPPTPAKRARKKKAADADPGAPPF